MHAPRSVVLENMLPEVDDELQRLQVDPEQYQGGLIDEYWDDFLLTKFLEGVCVRYTAYPVGDIRYTCGDYLTRAGRIRGG